MQDTYTEITSQWCNDTETGEIRGIAKTYCSKTHKLLSSKIIIIKPGDTQTTNYTV